MRKQVAHWWTRTQHSVRSYGGAVLCLLSVFAQYSCVAPECPRDQTVVPYHRVGLTFAQICEMTGHHICVTFNEPITQQEVEQLLPSLPGASVTCTQPTDPVGGSKLDWVIDLPDDMCCAEGGDYFLAMNNRVTGYTQPPPHDPCYCYYAWNNF